MAPASDGERESPEAHTARPSQSKVIFPFFL